MGGRKVPDLSVGYEVRYVFWLEAVAWSQLPQTIERRMEETRKRREDGSREELTVAED